VHVQNRRQRLADAERARSGIGQRDLAASVGHRVLALEDLAHDRHVVADAPVRLAPGLTVPAFDDLRAGDAEPGDHPAATGERVDGARGHRGRCRRAGRELHDAGAETDALRQGGQVRKRCDCVRAVGLGCPDRVEPETLREQDFLDRQTQLRSRVSDAQPELHAKSLLAIGDSYSISTPPSTLKLSPWTKLAASESRNRTAFAISSGLPKRPIGTRPATIARCSGVSGACIGVSHGPGLTQLMRIAVPATARAKPFVIVTTAPLLDA